MLVEMVKMTGNAFRQVVVTAAKWEGEKGGVISQVAWVYDDQVQVCPMAICRTVLGLCLPGMSSVWRAGLEEFSTRPPSMSTGRGVGACPAPHRPAHNRRNHGSAVWGGLRCV